MKLRNFLVALAVLAMASLSFGQGFQFQIGYFGEGDNLWVQGLTDYCPTAPENLGNAPTAGLHVPNGTPIVLYWGLTGQPYPANGTGQGFTVEGYPYSIENTWFVNGDDNPDGWDLPGGFYVQGPICISGAPTGAQTFWLVVETANVRWESEHKTFSSTSGPMPDWEVAGWTACETLVIPCTQPDHFDIPVQNWHTFAPYYQCLHLCPDIPTTICLHGLKADNVPHVAFIPGCHGQAAGCPEVACPDAMVGVVTPWRFVPSPTGQFGSWCVTIVSPLEGCVCMCVDMIESAELGSFDAVAGDNSVTLNWYTNSSSDVSAYQVMRDGELLHSVVAENSANRTDYTYTDNTAVNGTTYTYSLSVVDMDGNVQDMGVSVTATPSTNAAVITEYALHQNYPNPFNPTTNIVFDVVSDNLVTLKVYNAMGQEVATLVNGTQAAGRHTIGFDAANLTSGLYFYTVKIGNEFTATKKMMLVK